MNWLDIVILVIIVISTVLGLWVGIVKAALSLAGVVVGVILAGRYYVIFAERLTFIAQPGLARIAAFAIILIAVMVIAAVLASLIKWAVSAVMLGWIDRLVGAVFGLVLGVIFCGALLTIWVKFGGMTGPVSESALSALFLHTFPMVMTLLPGEFDSVRSFFQ